MTMRDEYLAEVAAGRLTEDATQLAVMDELERVRAAV